MDPARPGEPATEDPASTGEPATYTTDTASPREPVTKYITDPASKGEPATYCNVPYQPRGSSYRESGGFYRRGGCFRMGVVFRTCRLFSLTPEGIKLSLLYLLRIILLPLCSPVLQFNSQGSLCRGGNLHVMPPRADYKRKKSFVCCPQGHFLTLNEGHGWYPYALQKMQQSSTIIIIVLAQFHGI